MAGGPKLAAPVSRADMDAALGVPKLISGHTAWSRKANEAWAEARWRIRHEMSGIDLLLIATVNVRAPEKHTASVLWNEVRVAGICVTTPHRNKHTDSQQFGWEAHEHVWTDECNGSWCRAVYPAPLTIHEAVLQVCGGFGISFEADWEDPPGDYQIGMVAL